MTGQHNSERDISAWVNLYVADVAAQLFEARLTGIVENANPHYPNEKSGFWFSLDYVARALDVWLYYDARQNLIVDGGGLPPTVFYCDDIDDPFSKSFLQEWFHHALMTDAIECLVEALEGDALSISGQREPVLSRDQQEEELSFHALENRLWRIHRNKSRVETFNGRGQVIAVFRRCRLTFPINSAAQKLAEPAPIQTRIPNSIEQLERRAREIMTRDFDLSRGSQALAREFRARHQFDLTLKKLEQLFNQVRGGPLHPGRPRVSRRKSNW